MNNTEIITKENSYIGEKYYYIKHKSGLDIYVFPKKLSTYYALFGTKYGSVDNRFSVNGGNEISVPDGIAHFLEHKMFENEDGEDTFAKFARTGANANAYTSFDSTAYLFSCTENFARSLEILLSYVTSPYFTPETVAKEQGIIGQEIQMGEDNPARVLDFNLLKAMYERHSVRTEIAGTVESIKNITAELLYKCYNTFYNLSNMGLCVSGDVTAEQVVEVADRVLKRCEPIKINRVYAAEKPQVAQSRKTAYMQVAKPLFAIGVKDTDISEDPMRRMHKSACMNIICDMLFGRSSKFYSELYENGLISASFSSWFEHNSGFSYMALCGDSRDPEAVYSSFEKHTADFYSNTCREDFERCRRVLYANTLKRFDSTEDIANNFLINYIFDGGDVFDYIDIVRNVRYEDVAEVAEKLFRKEAYAMSVVRPVSEKTSK